MNSVIQFLVKMQSDAKSVIDASRKVQDELNQVNEKAKKVKGSLSDAFSGKSLGNALMNTPGMQLLLNPYTMIAAGVGAVAKLGAEAEMTATAFTTLVGSEQKANGLLKEITKFADETPFDKLQLTQNAQEMMNFGVESDKVMGYLKQLGDISGGNAERFSSLSLVFGQVSASGKLAGQDLMQFINAGFNPLKELQTMTGKSYKELQEMMSDGRITSENVAQAIAHATGEGGKFHGMMLATSQTVAGQWSTAIGNLQTMATELFEKLKPLIMEMFGAFNAILPRLSAVLKFVFSIVAWGIGFIIKWKDELMLLAGIVTVVMAVTKAYSIGLFLMTNIIKGVTLVTQAWGAVQAMLNVVLMMNPIGLVIMAIGVLIAVGIYCWNKFAGFRAFLLTMWDTMKGFGEVIKTYVVNRINELLGAIGNVGKALKLLFTGDFEGAKNAAGEAVKQFAGVNSTATAVEGAKNVANGIGDSWANNLAEENRKQASKDKQKSGISTPALAGSAPIGEVIFGEADGKKKGKKKGKNSKSTDAIATGGQRNTSITMTIGKFFDAINVHMMDKTDTSELQRIILETLNRSLAIATSSDR